MAELLTHHRRRSATLASLAAAAVVGLTPAAALATSGGAPAPVDQPPPQADQDDRSSTERERNARAAERERLVRVRGRSFERLLRKRNTLARRYADRTQRPYRAFGQVRSTDPTALLYANRRLKREIPRLRERLRWAIPDSARRTLTRIGRCESGGNPRAVSSNGVYRGLLQFDYRTWASVGGHGDPAQASLAEQLYRGWRLLRSRGTSPWPICG